jgi:hypothetical protein
MFDNGASPKDVDEDKKGGSRLREELGWFTSPHDDSAGHKLTCHTVTSSAAILYASNVLGSRGPRKMQVCIPRVNPSDDTIEQWRESKDRSVNMPPPFGWVDAWHPAEPL